MVFFVDLPFYYLAGDLHGDTANLIFNLIDRFFLFLENIGLCLGL